MTNAGDYLVFSNQAEFEETQNTIDDLGPTEGVSEHLANWEEQHGNFYSVRRYYADLEQQGDTTSLSPVPDPYFAAVLSPKGLIQVGATIYRIDFTGDKVFCIPAAQKNELYDDFVAGNNNANIRYYYRDENLFAALAANDFGTPVGTVRQEDPQRNCVAGANEDDTHQQNRFYSSNQRLACRLAYNKYGLYFTMTGSARNQKRFLGAYLAQRACLYTVPDQGAFWEERCPYPIPGSYTTADYNYCGGLGPNGNYDNNEVTARAYHSVNGLRSYTYDVKFNIGGNGGFTTETFHIDGL